MQIALAGNPNTGKTSLFNILTGSYEYVGNWSGVTVEKKVGVLKKKDGTLTDLPGIYTLIPLTADEEVATHCLLHDDYSLILNIVDASQLERNLYLTLQLLEFGKPILMGLNMLDVAKSYGLAVNINKLSRLLNIPIIPIIARTGHGCADLTRQFKQVQSQEASPFHLDYGWVLEQTITKLSRRLPEQLTPPKRWLCLQFLEGNKLVGKLLEKYIPAKELQELLTETEEKIKQYEKAKSIAQHIRLKRMQYIDQLASTCLSKEKEVTITFSDRLDAVVTHKFWGIPIFLAFMFLMFKFTFDWFGTPLSDVLDAFFSGPLTDGLTFLFDRVGASDFIKAVILNGIVSGVGGVLVFVPQIFMLFFLISFIEDSGYMARVALVMDRIMEKMGLNGKTFIPMIIGFGCNVPGVMAARTIEQPKERLLTILLTPLMSCSARLSVYSLFVGTFFVKNQALIVLSLYVLGIVVAMILAKVFSSTLFKQEGDSIFVIELPPYRIPQWKTLSRSTWEKGKGFVRKAGTFIFGGSVAIWLLSYAGPTGINVDMDKSFLALIGGWIAPLFAPIGFGTWQASAALLTGFLAKEVVVSTMNIIYAAPDADSLKSLISGYFSPLAAYSFMVFILLYVPCLATVAVIYKETASRKWTWFSVIYALVIAYMISLIIYQGGRWLGF
ncbi:MAG TPA: ferrous iron transport protein B [Bacillota bacterium]|nr:ferrous iron transport protein B [Bacillota bacterium]